MLVDITALYSEQVDWKPEMLDTDWTIWCEWGAGGRRLYIDIEMEMEMETTPSRGWYGVDVIPSIVTRGSDRVEWPFFFVTIPSTYGLDHQIFANDFLLSLATVPSWAFHTAFHTCIPLAHSSSSTSSRTLPWESKSLTRSSVLC